MAPIAELLPCVDVRDERVMSRESNVTDSACKLLSSSSKDFEANVEAEESEVPYSSRSNLRSFALMFGAAGAFWLLWLLADRAGFQVSTPAGRNVTTELEGDRNLTVAQVSVAQVSCTHIEHDVEFHTREIIRRVDDIFSVDMCCSACSADPECRAWEWGAKQDVMALSNSCYLRKLGHGEKVVRVKRPGLVSGILAHRLEKHGIVSDVLTYGRLQVPEPFLNRLETCPGAVSMTGLGSVSVVAALWHSSWRHGRNVDVATADLPAEGGGAVLPHLFSRAYFAYTCSAGKYNSSEYVGLELLGGTFRYRVDMSEVGCGCDATLYLVPMRGSSKPGECKDYYCSPQNHCGVACPTIRLQDANKFAWASTVHTRGDSNGISVGYGGFQKLVGRRDWTATEYGPGSACIDTSWPVDVEFRFPTDDEGMLKAVELTLSQEGHACKLERRIDEYNFQGRDGLAELSQVLLHGVTPMMGYWASEHLRWMDGLGPDGQGPCVKDVPQACPRTTRFSHFGVDWTQKAAPPRNGHGPLMAALFAMHQLTALNAHALQVSRLREATPMEGPINSFHVGDAFPSSEGDLETTVELSATSDEWEVLVDLPIRSSPAFGAKVLWTAHTGGVLIGKRVQEQWLQLLRQPGFALIHRRLDQVYLYPRQVVYRRLGSGSCQKSGMFHIANIRTCEAASFALGYFDTFVNVYSDKSDKPYGCYVMNGQLFLVTNEANMGNSVGNRTPLCVNGPYPTTTTTSTTHASAASSSPRS
mmetsp:Transcript_138694/g.386768  ORF Transcript_138694/g.386768 Transcript_138694/m.386768 type:complete len:757 (+) Transcript_138694:43-2313(+)|eukprot:CAMPEP_0179102196 /NCGR_PEP_ID=MMETSP0796-20121207/47288_1 /TAXON_ID=73915 /ORGANISM="Pyrodinium bahamense, Strain pbaha01" /LENGTH=756 /DNA_ID=CAMNT_0020800065 /DNA_START=40 /DNA_END=2310 /DNA_ORIENTATION=+